MRPHASSTHPPPNPACAARPGRSARPGTRLRVVLRTVLAAVAASFAGLGLTLAPARAQAPTASQAGGAGAAGDGTTGPSGATGTTGAGATGSTGATSAATPLTLTRTQARAVQRKLHVRADGAFGNRSRAALKRWERGHGLAADGRPDTEDLRRMGVRLTTAQAASVGAGGDPTAAAASAPSAAAQQAVQAAMTQVGDPYVTGGTGGEDGGFDCSGLTQWAFAQAGVALPHSSFDQFTMGVAVPQDQIQAGDLVFFDSAGPGASDVGIATGPTTTVSSTTQGVMEHPTFDSYWGGHFVGARRVA